MDVTSHKQQEATVGSVPSVHSQTPSSPHTQSAEAQSTTATTNTSSRPLRTSARVRAAKQKSVESATSSVAPSASAESSSAPAPRTTTQQSKSKRTRETSKSKSKESAPEAILPPAKRARRVVSAPLTINELIPDTKGKKRANPEPDSEEEPSSSIASAKRSRTRSYSLRSRADTSLIELPEMTKKSRSSTAKGKDPVKAKMAAASSSRMVNEDFEMTDHARGDGSSLLENMAEMGDDDDDDDDDEDDDDDNGHGEGGGDLMGDDDLNEDKEENDDEASPMGFSSGGLRGHGLSIFGDFSPFGSHMVGLSSRLKTMLNNIKMTADPTTRLLTLQELSELLSISTEDTLAGSFQVEQFVRELVRILGGRGASDDEDDDDEGEPQDEDAALAAALSLSGGNAFAGDENLEAQVLACRCLANLMEALPGVAHTVVYHGAIPVLCSKLIEISYIDLAEQTLSTLEKISEEFPSAIVREGGLAALLNYLDFFSIAVQRTALQAAANCCRNLSSEQFGMIQAVWPIIRNCLTYSDQRLVEFACVCVIRVIDSYHRSSVGHLEQLVDKELIRAVNTLLLPAGGSPLIAANTYTLLLRALATSARASPKITVVLLEADIVNTVYQILTGVLPPSDADEEQGDAASGQGLGGGLADMTVMENLAHRPKDQVEETLGLISDLMPPLPKDGVFDHKGYTEKSLARMIKAKSKAERAAARQSQATAQTTAAPETVALSSTAQTSVETLHEDVPSQEASATPTPDHEAGSPIVAESPPQLEPSLDRSELLRSNMAVVNKFMTLMVPILIDVYAASVITPVRIRTLTGILKAVSFLEPAGLKQVLHLVPVASFVSSILSSKDHPSLVIGGLQLAELLLAKLPAEYKPTFRREGVFFEIDAFASRDLSVKTKEKDKDQEETLSEVFSATLPPLSVASIPGLKKISSLSLDPEDAITLRVRVIKHRYITDSDGVNEDSSFESLKDLVGQLGSPQADEASLSSTLKSVADLFASPQTSISSFELLQSGLVDSLLQYSTSQDAAVPLEKRQELLLEAFTSRGTKASDGAQTPLSVFVKKLQESLTRMEPYEVVTVAQGSDDSKRSSPSLLARQLRLRLSAGEDSDIPKNLQNIVVSIHAIATFQALHDYLRPRVAGVMSGGSRLSSMLAALAAHGYASGSSRASLEEAVAAAQQAISGGSLSSTSVPPAPRLEPTESEAPKRRRSLRLSAKQSGSSAGNEQQAGDVETSPPNNNAAPATSSTVDVPMAQESASTAGAGNLLLDDHRDTFEEADFTDNEVDAEVFEDDMDPDTSIHEKTISLNVEEGSSKVVAQTPEGTRVGTPSASSGTTAAAARRSLQPRSSYAAALKAKPSDWHLQFSMDDHILPLDLTIYGAIHQHEMRKKSGPAPSGVFWQGVYTITFKKVSGPAPSPEVVGDGLDSSTRSRSPKLLSTSLPEDAPHSKILKLLRVLHQLNVTESEKTAYHGENRALPESAFVNNKLSAKLTRQLEETMIVASSCLPDWALDLPQHFPFLFPFATRYNFLQSTSFGYARLILKWQSQQSRGQDSSRRDEGIGFLGRLQRQKVRISRKHILESAVKVFELYGSSSSVLEVEYFEEVGTGLGPTLEFYSLVSKEFARRDLKLWRDADQLRSGPFVHHPTGLFPAPISSTEAGGDGVQKRLQFFKVIGQFVAKAMLDSRIIDLSFNKIFLKLVLGEEVPLKIATLKAVDEDLGNSLARLQLLAGGSSDSPSDKLFRKTALVEGTSIDDLALDFTIPGYDIELYPGSRNIAVTQDNVHDYIRMVLDAILGTGAQLPAKAFREGFSKVFPISELRAFSADELVMLFGNTDEDWSIETLSEVVKADHGFNPDSRAIHELIEVMAAYDLPARRDFLQFISGSPKLPIGGFRGLNPPLTVVRKPHEAPLTADDYLPSVMTCVNYLKLPEYSSKDIMREKLRIAMKEGVGSFHLS